MTQSNQNLACLADAESYFLDKISNLPVPSERDIEQEWLAIICLLTDPEWHLNDERSRIDKTSFRYRQYAMTEFIRLKWDSKFKFKPLDVSIPRVHSKLHKLEGMLWYRVLNLVQEVFLLKPSGYPHPASWFGGVLFESKLVGPFTTDLNKTSFFKQLRSENAQLEDFSNPFSDVAEPQTWKLITLATHLAETKDRFRSESFNPMVRARQVLTTHLAKEGQVIEPTDKGLLVGRQGRRKQPKNKDVFVTCSGQKFGAKKSNRTI